MAGRFTASNEQLRPDPRFGSKVLARFINCVMREGKKAVAERVVYDAMEEIQKRLEKETDPNAPKEAIQVFDRAISNVKPRVEVRSKRVGGANYQVPIPVNDRRQQSLAFRWIIESCRKDGGKPMSIRLADELIAAAKGEGKAMGIRDQTHRMADANKAFAHFAY
jgi:small subunit ribosomal protein S7